MRKTVIALVLMLLLVEGTALAGAWDDVTFSKPYDGEKSMSLLIEWAWGEYDMTLVDGRWMVGLELPRGRYCYNFSPNRADWSRVVLWGSPSQSRILLNHAVYVGYQEMTSEHFAFHYLRIDQPHVEAIRGILESAYQGLVVLYGIDAVARNGGKPIDVLLEAAPEKQSRLSGLGQIWFEAKPGDLRPPTVPGGRRQVYGFTHELVHQLAYFDNQRDNETVAVVIAAHLVTHYIWPRLGSTAWPEPYDYRRVEGEEWIRETMRDPEVNRLYNLGLFDFLWDVLDEAGPATFGKALNQLPRLNTRAEDVRRLCEHQKN